MLEAIVLSRKSFKEFDEIISLYSKEKGKVELLAKGVKKTVSKNSPHLEPFSEVYVGVVGGKDLDYITSVQGKEYFSGIRTDLSKLRQAGFAVSFLNSVLSLGEKNTALYETLLSWLEFLSTVSKTNLSLLDSLMLKIIGFLGFEPGLNFCIICGKSFTPEDKLFFSFTSGGVICQKDKIENREETAVPITLSLLLALRYLLKGSWREIEAYNGDATFLPVHKIVYHYILYCTEKNILDWNKNPTFE